MIRYFLSIVCLILGPLAAFGSNVCHDALEPRLSEKQKSVLRAAAARDDYEVRVLRGEVDGRERMIVLLGESHVKTKEDHEIGQKVVAEFPNRGLEGADLKKYWGGRAVSRLLDHTQARNTIRTDDGQVRTHGSTIDTALQEAKERAMVGQLVYKIRSGQATLNDLKEEFTGVEIDVEGENVLPRVMARVEATLRILESGTSVQVQPNQIRIFHLEAEHQPGFRENIGSLFRGFGHLARLKLAPITSLKCQLGALCASLLAPHLMPGNALAHDSAAIVMLSMVGLWVIPPVIETSGQVLMDHTLRDPTMVKAIHDGFKKFADMDMMLVVVGRLHVDSQVRLLHKYGFRESFVLD